MPAIIGWVLLVVLCTAIGSWAGMRQATSTQLTTGEAGRAATTLAAAGLSERDSETVVFGAAGSGRLAASTVAAVRSDLAITLSRVPGVATVGAPVLSTAATPRSGR